MNNVDGILLLNKSTGITSNKALQQAKRLFAAKKAGHTGCLDPLATGMLPLCFGEATKICQYLLDADKCYEASGLLGIKTNTSDSTGEITATVEEFTVTEEQLHAALSLYRGNIEQIPSMFSALKHQGKPLYRLARQGIEIERKARAITISQLDLQAFDGKNFSLKVTCTKGTYIRNLVEDIGDSLQVGAHVTRLHRVHTSSFQDLPMYTLDELIEMSPEQRIACLIPMDKAVDYLPQVMLSDDEIICIRQGKILTGKEPSDIERYVRLYNTQNNFVGLGQYRTNGDVAAKRLLAF